MVKFIPLKNQRLYHRILLATSNKNDFILDPFLGSGTTATVAKKLGEIITELKKKNYLKLLNKD